MSTRMEATQMLAHLQRKGVRLWLEQGQLKYRAPKGLLTHAELEGLRTSKEQIKELLDGGARVIDLSHVARAHVRYAPLAYSQQAHWNLYGLSRRPAIRQIASATRLRGRLDVPALKISLSQVSRRHDALRTRVVTIDGQLTQQIRENETLDLRMNDLRGLPGSQREDEVQRHIENLILEPLDVSVGPLSAVELLRLDQDEHVLIVAQEHMVSDAVSMGILLRDLFHCYTQSVLQRAPSLPPVGVQFSEYALWQKQKEPLWLEQHLPYWQRQLADCGRLRFPPDPHLVAGQQGWDRVPVRIDAELKERLREWARTHQTTLVMTLFTTFVALVLRWCGLSRTILQHQIDGRNNPKIEHSMGYFAALLYLRVELQPDNNFLDLLTRVTQEYCNAYEHNDSFYMEAQVPPPAIAHNSAFNWIRASTGIDLAGLEGTEHELQFSPVPFIHPITRNLQKDNEPVLVLSERGAEIVGDLYFALDQFSHRTMEHFVREWQRLLEVLMARPHDKIVAIPIITTTRM